MFFRAREVLMSLIELSEDRIEQTKEKEAVARLVGGWCR
jgi:hypothetical protein